MGDANAVTARDLGIFVDEGTDPVTAQNTHTDHAARRIYTSCGRVLPRRPMRPMTVALSYVLGKDQPQMPLRRRSTATLVPRREYLHIRDRRRPCRQPGPAVVTGHGHAVSLGCRPLHLARFSPVSFTLIGPGVTLITWVTRRSPVQDRQDNHASHHPPRNTHTITE